MATLEEFERQEKRVNIEIKELIVYALAGIVGVTLIVEVIIFAIRGF